VGKKGELKRENDTGLRVQRWGVEGGKERFNVRTLERIGRRVGGNRWWGLSGMDRNEVAGIVGWGGDEAGREAVC